MYFIIIFVPPLYFLIRRKWGGFILNLALMVLAGVTIFFFFIGFVFWILAIGHASWHYRRELMEKHAELIAAKIKETENK